MILCAVRVLLSQGAACAPLESNSLYLCCWIAEVPTSDAVPLIVVTVCVLSCACWYSLQRTQHWSKMSRMRQRTCVCYAAIVSAGLALLACVPTVLLSPASVIPPSEFGGVLRVAVMWLPAFVLLHPLTVFLISMLSESRIKK